MDWECPSLLEVMCKRKQSPHYASIAKFDGSYGLTCQQRYEPNQKTPATISVMLS